MVNCCCCCCCCCRCRCCFCSLGFTAKLIFNISKTLYYRYLHTLLPNVTDILSLLSKHSDLSSAILLFYPDFRTPLRLHHVITTCSLFAFHSEIIYCTSWTTLQSLFYPFLKRQKKRLCTNLLRPLKYLRLVIPVYGCQTGFTSASINFFEKTMVETEPTG